ncbi:hypothetical protein RhiirC2_417794 [Rhizophagus irregularis]|uniref:Uncharacterized protein n=1 Tax=Rhizophagus irregularis TaxID=588596 RepID=A0A2N1NZF4_9GLOM|nr:hypothetical protein RhiirC2_417794 [Rhizophagus irregularis]
MVLMAYYLIMLTHFLFFRFLDDSWTWSVNFFGCFLGFGTILGRNIMVFWIGNVDAMRYQRHLRHIKRCLLESNQLEQCSKPLTT